MSSDNILLKATIKIISLCYSALGLIIFVIWIFWIWLIPIQFLDIWIDNQIYTRGMDVILKIWLSLLALAMTTLWAVMYKRTLSKVPSLLAVGLLFTFALSLSILWSFNTVKNFSYEAFETEEIVLPLEENQNTITLDKFNLYWNEYFVFDWELDRFDVEFIKLDDDKKRLKIKIQNTVHTKDDARAKEIFNNINKINYKLEWDKISLYRENNSTFINPMEVTWLERKVVIYAPEDLIFKSNLDHWRDWAIINLPSNWNYNYRYWSSYYDTCSRWVIKYEKQHNWFMCDLNAEDKARLEEQKAQEEKLEAEKQEDEDKIIEEN